MEDFYDLPPLQMDQVVPGTRDYDIVEWCESRLIRGRKFLESQVGYDKIQMALDEIFSFERSTQASYVPGASRSLSQTKANLVAKIAEDVTAMLTDTRPFWNYSSQNQLYDKQCEIANKTAEQWYQNNLISLRLGDVIRDYTYAGTGVAHLYYSRSLDEMLVEAEDPRNVFPVDPLSYHTFQDARGVILRRPRTPEWVMEEFGKRVKPDSGAGSAGFFGWLSGLVSGPGERSGPLSKKSKSDTPGPGPDSVYVNTLYLRDKRKNNTNSVVRLGPWTEDGQPKTPWSYEVAPGKSLYPFHRMVVWGSNTLLYDGPSPYWHAKFPVIKFTLNPWSRTWFGKAPLWDCLPLQTSITANLRVIDDHAAQVAQPALLGDRNVSRAEMNKANTRAAGMKMRTNMASGKGLQIVPPPPLDQLIWEAIKWCEEKMQKLSGTVDMSAMSALGQMPSADTVDTVMKAMTPGIRLRSRILEGAYTELAEMYLYCIFEFDTISKRIARLGPNAVTAEDFDYDPGNMIPDDVPGGEAGDVANSSLILQGPRPLHARARAMLASMACKFDPASLLNSAAQQELMKYFMLAKMGYVSVFTLMEKMGVTNYLPSSINLPSSEVERLQLQMQLGIGMVANAQGRKATDSAPPSMGESGNGPIIQTS